MVYFIQCNNLVKIGYSSNAKKRLKQLQAHSPVELNLLKVTYGNWKREQELHKIFAHLRKYGEWFELNSDLEKYIDAQPTYNPTPTPTLPVQKMPLHPTLREVEKQHIIIVLAAYDKNMTLSARILGIDRKTLYRKLKEYKLENPSEVVLSSIHSIEPSSNPASDGR